MAIGISPTVDFAFKLMLGSPEHSSVTIHFLNAILGGRPKITHVEILNPFLGKDAEDDKLSVLDILATDEHGRTLNIEMQTSLVSELAQRLTYYASSLYADQLTEGVGYSALRPVISICVLTKSMFPQIPALHLDFRLREFGGQILTDDLQIHLLELPKLRVTAENVYHASVIERWAYFLRNAETLTREDVVRMFPDREIAEAAGVLEMISQTPEERRRYQARLKFQRDEAARLESARNDALREGHLEGHLKGHLEGHLEGHLQGLREGEAKGELYGRIKVLQQLLGITESTRDELSSYDESQLNEMAERLQSEFHARGQ